MRSGSASVPSTLSGVQEALQLAGARRVLQLAQRLGLDLADTFARDRELLPDLLQSVVGVHADAEAHAQHTLLAGRQRRQHAGRGLAQIGLDRRLQRQHRELVLDEVTQMAEIGRARLNSSHSQISYAV